MTELTLNNARAAFQTAYPGHSVWSARVARGTRTELYAEAGEILITLHISTDPESRKRSADRPVKFATFSRDEIGKNFKNIYRTRWGSVDSPTPPTLEDLVSAIRNSNDSN